MNTFTIVQLVHLDDTGDSYYRMRWPSMDLAEKRSNWRVVNLAAQANERFEYAEKADLLVLYQSQDLDLLPTIARRQKLGLQTLVEYNDNFYAPPSASPVAKEWSSPLLWQRYELFMQEASGLIVTGKGLAELFKNRAPAIHILENHFPFEPESFSTAWTEPKDKIVLGWAGSLGHIADFLAALPIVRKLLAEFPKLHFHVMGNETIEQLLQIDPSRYSFRPWGGMQEYLEFWRPVHVGFTPMNNTPYNKGRSDIKAVEMSACGVVPVLSTLGPYAEFIKQTDAPTFSSLADLEKTLRSLIAAPDKLKALAEHCYSHVCTSRLQRLRNERAELFERHLPKKPQAHNWQFDAGYHEVLGTPEDRPRYVQILQSAQEALKAKNSAGAQELIGELLKLNPLNPEVCYAQAKVLHLQKDRALTSFVKECAAKFPRDLRFEIIETVSATDVAERRKLWTALIKRLAHQSTPEREFFLQESGEPFCISLRVDDELIGVAEELLSYAPNYAALVYELAEAYLRTGNEVRSQEMFSHTAELKRDFELNRRFLAKAPENYLQAWAETLAVRLGR